MPHGSSATSTRSREAEACLSTLATPSEQTNQIVVASAARAVDIGDMHLCVERQPLDEVADGGRQARVERRHAEAARKRGELRPRSSCVRA